jgi:hypothetical protein
LGVGGHLGGVWNPSRHPEWNIVTEHFITLHLAFVAILVLVVVCDCGLRVDTNRVRRDVGGEAPKCGCVRPWGGFDDTVMCNDLTRE